MRNKPFLIASIFFGATAVLLLIISGMIFLTKDTSFCNSIGRILGMKSGSITNSTIAELAVIFTVPAFIFAYKSISNEENQ